MNIKFKQQQFQQDAANSVTNLFLGQSKKILHFDIDDNSLPQYSIGTKNNKIDINEEKIYSNLKNIQFSNGINLDSKLTKIYGTYSFDIQMETGTGKTYTYLKTIFELNKKYNFTKFIIVVPSIAIREGIKKTIEITKNHFFQIYSKSLNSFIYNSKNIEVIRDFSSNTGIQIMIINHQAFSSKIADSNDKLKTRRIIDTKSDIFNSDSPINMIAKTNPIMIIDEPQKLGQVAKESLKKFSPLFFLNYSATHKEKHNLIYVLDTIKAFKESLIKKIQVWTLSLKDNSANEAYIYFDKIILSPTLSPKARIEINIKYENEIKKIFFNLKVKDDLYLKSKEFEPYKDGYIVSEIKQQNGVSQLCFINGKCLNEGEIIGLNADDDQIRKLQIYQTIDAHLKKEFNLFQNNIKSISLFFIDKVDKYRNYDENNNPIPGKYAKYFEEIYSQKVLELIKEYENNPSEYPSEYKFYVNYLKSNPAAKVHNGYFAKDKKTNKFKDSKEKGSQDESDTIDAYDLILKDKERLLSFSEPTKFIFSHSALREGWDNPNIFQICTLNKTNSEVKKHQEIGRGLRLPINQDGERIDKSNSLYKDINVLSVIVNESYEKFVNSLQEEIAEDSYNYQTNFDFEYLEKNKEKLNIKSNDARILFNYLESNYLVDKKLSIELKNDLNINKMKDPHEEAAKLIIENIKLKTFLLDWFIPQNYISKVEKSEVQNSPNKFFNEPNFLKLWNIIKKRYFYLSNFDTKQIINMSIKKINDNLQVPRSNVKISIGNQNTDAEKEEYLNNNAFKIEKETIKNIDSTSSHVKYDLVGKIEDKTRLKKQTIANILASIDKTKFDLFKQNPEIFINKISQIINEEKGKLIVNNIKYIKSNESDFNEDIFKQTIKINSLNQKGDNNDFKKHVLHFLSTDGYATNSQSIEQKFAQDMENNELVKQYLKLPKTFSIPTPLGNYTPDWAIVFDNEKNNTNYLYFIAETKGSTNELELREIEKIKIECAKKLFKEINKENNDINYGIAKSFDELINQITT